MSTSYKHIRTSLQRGLQALAVAVLCLIVVGCSSSELEQQIRIIAADPSLQTMQSYSELVEIIRNSPDEYGKYLDESGKIDAQKLQKAIDNIGREVDKDFSWNTLGYAATLNRPLTLCLMLERSGSMNGYDAREGSGDFKRAINELVTRFPDDAAGDMGNILIVNSEIQPYKGSFQQFVQDRNIFYTTRNVGDASYTDFGKIFKQALSDTTQGRITVLVTDMIYSPEGVQGVGSDKLRNEEASLMSHLGKSYPDKSMLLVRLNADFIGQYYPYSSPKGGQMYKGKRPYYMIFMGNKVDMDRMLTGSEYASMRDFASLPGFEDYYYLGRGSVHPGYYALLPRSKSDTGLYSVAPGAGRDGSSKVLTDIEAEPKSGKYTFSIAADLSAVPADGNYVIDSNNWTTTKSEMVQVLGVERITDEMRNVRNNRYLSKATHILRMQGDQRASGDVEIRLQNRVPAWVSAGSTTDDRNLSAATFATTTFGLQDMVQGLYNGSYGTAQAPDYIVYTIKID